MDMAALSLALPHCPCCATAADMRTTGAGLGRGLGLGLGLGRGLGRGLGLGLGRGEGRGLGRGEGGGPGMPDSGTAYTSRAMGSFSTTAPTAANHSATEWRGKGREALVERNSAKRRF